MSTQFVQLCKRNLHNNSDNQLSPIEWLLSEILPYFRVCGLQPAAIVVAVRLQAAIVIEDSW